MEWHGWNGHAQGMCFYFNLLTVQNVSNTLGIKIMSVFKTKYCL
jgi:hypothetical protein